MKNYDYYYKRQSSIINKSIINETVSDLFIKNYNEFEGLNPEIVADVYLYLTANYDPKEDFVKQFISKYKNLKFELDILRLNIDYKEIEIKECPI